MTVLEILHAKLGTDVLKAQLVDVTVAEVEQAIKNYCNIDTVPEALNFVWANIVEDYIRYQKAICDKDNSSSSSTVNLAEVSSLKIGDTNISLGGTSTLNPKAIAIRSHVPNLDVFVKNYREQLNKFRRMVW